MGPKAEISRVGEDRFERLVEAVVDYAIFWLDADGRVSSWNSGAQRIKGYSAAEILGRPYATFFTAKDRAAGVPERALAEARQSGRYQGEGWRVRKDGSRFWASAVIDRIADADGRLIGFAKITRDDTPRREADEALREAHALLEARVVERTREAERRTREAELARAEALAASQAKSRFFSAASHDLRQPVQAARLFFDVLAARLEGGDNQPIIDQAAQALATTEELLNSLLDVARIDSGAVAAAPRAVQLSSLLAPLVNELGPRAAAKGVALRHVPSSLQVHTDPTMVRRIIQNLIENAVKYTEAGKILVGCRRRGDAILLEVWDTGPGIAKSHLHHIWDEFYQVGNVARDRSEGLGLGLSIVQKLAATLGHRLEVASVVGKGSVFRVVLR